MHKRFDSDPQSSSSYQVIGKQQITDYSEANYRLEEFDKYFVKQFEAKLHAYYLISEGETKKAGKFSDAFSKKIGQAVGGTAGGLIGFLFALPVAGAKLGTTAGEAIGTKVGSKIGSKQHEKKVTKLLDLIDLALKDKFNLRRLLVEAGFDIFQSFEMQFMRVTTDQGSKKAMELLAEDATNRAINYYIHKKDALITEGVVLGESKIEPILGVPIFTPIIKTPGFEIKYKYESDEKNWCTASLFEKVGLVIEGKAPTGDNRYYEVHEKSKTDKYGYRRLFISESWDELKDKYTSSDVTKSREFMNYQYILNSKDFEEKSKDILEKINRDDKNLVEERITKIVEQVKNDVIEEINALKKQSHCYEDDRKILETIKTNLKNLNVNEYLKKYKQYFEEAKQERQKIAKAIVANLEERREHFNQLSQKQDIHHDDNKKEHKKIQEVVKRIERKIDIIGPQKDQNKDSVWFDMREPVKSFTRRGDKLQELHMKLHSESEKAVISQTIVITGLGGIGKSELARKYAYDYAKDYNGNVIWINVEKKEDRIKSFEKLATVLKTPISRNPQTGAIDLESTTQSVYKYFKNTTSLFIFDNAEEYEDIKKILPYSLDPNNKKPHILITSRNRDWEVGEEGRIEEVPLSEFSPKEATEFIKKVLDIKIEDNSRDEEIKQLAKEVQYFPLALQQATACIKERNAKLKTRSNKKFGVNDYLREYKEEVQKIVLLNFKSKHGNDRYIKTAFTTWKTTLKNIEQKGNSGKHALEIMHIMAYLAPSDVSIERFFLKLVGDEEQMWCAVELLDKYSMINLKYGISNVHRLVQEVIRLELKKQEKEEVLRKALELINNASLEKEDTNHVVSIWNYASQYEQLINDYYFDSIYGEKKNTPLHLFATSGNKEAIERVLSNVQRIYEKFKKHHAPDLNIDYAMRRVKNCINAVGYAPVHIAAFTGHLEILKYFIEEQKVNAKLVPRDINELTPTMYAALVNKLNMVRYWGEIYYAVCEGCDKNSYKIINYLLDIHPELINCNTNGFTPLFCAVVIGDKKTIETLLRRGANVNVKTSNAMLSKKNSNTGVSGDFKNLGSLKVAPLHIAANRDFFKITKLLLKYGAIYNVIDEQRNTPSDVAKPGSDVKKLLNEIDQLFQAVRDNEKDIVNCLLEGKDLDTLEAILNARNIDDSTLLHVAVANEQRDIADLLKGKLHLIPFKFDL